MKKKIELVTKIRDVIYDYIYDEFGQSEADNPSWYIPSLAERIVDKLLDENYKPEHQYYNIDDEEWRRTKMQTVICFILAFILAGAWWLIRFILFSIGVAFGLFCVACVLMIPYTLYFCARRLITGNWNGFLDFD